MKIRLRPEYDTLFSILDKKGRIHRPHIYVMDKSCGWQWEMLNNKRTGHWHMTVGRIVFTTM